MAGIVTGTPVAPNRGNGTFAAVGMDSTALVFFMGLGFISTRSSLETSVGAAYFMTSLIVSTPVAPAR